MSIPQLLEHTTKLPCPIHMPFLSEDTPFCALILDTTGLSKTEHQIGMATLLTHTHRYQWMICDCDTAEEQEKAEFALLKAISHQIESTAPDAAPVICTWKGDSFLWPFFRARCRHHNLFAPNYHSMDLAHFWESAHNFLGEERPPSWQRLTELLSKPAIWPSIQFAKHLQKATHKEAHRLFNEQQKKLALLLDAATYLNQRMQRLKTTFLLPAQNTRILGEEGSISLPQTLISDAVALPGVTTPSALPLEATLCEIKLENSLCMLTYHISHAAKTEWYRGFGSPDGQVSWTNYTVKIQFRFTQALWEKRNVPVGLFQNATHKNIEGPMIKAPLFFLHYEDWCFQNLHQKARELWQMAL